MDGIKRIETRTHTRLRRGLVGIVHDGRVIGEVIIGFPVEIRRDSAEYGTAMIAGTEYDIPQDGMKYGYPVTVVNDWRDNPRPVLRHGNYAVYVT